MGFDSRGEQFGYVWSLHRVTAGEHMTTILKYVLGLLDAGESENNVVKSGPGESAFVRFELVASDYLP